MLFSTLKKIETPRLSVRPSRLVTVYCFIAQIYYLYIFVCLSPTGPKGTSKKFPHEPVSPSSECITH